MFTLIRLRSVEVRQMQIAERETISWRLLSGL